MNIQKPSQKRFTEEHGKNAKDFDIGKTIGKGSYGKVFSCKSRLSGAYFALKMMSKERLLAENLGERVVNEIEVHSQLSHPNVVRLFHSFEDEENVYLVLELCSNGNMSEFLKRKNLIEEKEAKQFILQLLLGLEYLHSYGIIHRDLKLSNILLAENNQIKIADFGLAAILGSVEEARNTVCGTPNYMSPEVIANKSYSFPADMWSVGCILYCFLTGKSPFVSSNIPQILKKAKSAEFSIPTSISPQAADLISKLLKKEPSERLDVQSVLKHPFLEVPEKTQKRNSFAVRKPSEEHSGLTPLDTTRLPPISHQTTHTNVHLMQNGEVCIEFIKDGLFFIVSKNGKSIEVSSPTGTWLNNSYNLDTLPKSLYSKYRYAQLFVESARSKTVKVEYRGFSVHCSLMENGPLNDFEILFLKKQLLVVYQRQKGLIHIRFHSCNATARITDRFSFEAYDPVINSVSILEYVQGTNAIADHEYDLVTTAKYLRKCLRIERKGMERLSRFGCDPFPIIEYHQRSTPTKSKTPRRFIEPAVLSQSRSGSISWSLSDESDRVNTSTNTCSTPSSYLLSGSSVSSSTKSSATEETTSTHKIKPISGGRLSPSNGTTREDWNVLFE